jgi:predicted RNA-binding Zn ribbon-like protein
MRTYRGPIRQDPLAIELHNTVYAEGSAIVDGLADKAQARAWLDEIGARLPLDSYPPGPLPGSAALAELRDAIRVVLRGAVEDEPVDVCALDVINAASGRAPCSPVAVLQSSGAVAQRSSYHGATRAEVALAAFARDAIELVTGPRRGELRRCGAPGCVLLFLGGDSRRAWCSNACGNRARQARHYRRTHASSP